MDDILVFSPQKREPIRGELVAGAKTDPRIGGAAHLVQQRSGYRIAGLKLISLGV